MCVGGEGSKLRSFEPTTDRHRSIVLDHRRKAENPAQDPDSDVGQEVTVQVVHHDPEPAHPSHFAEQADGVGIVEVMQEKGSVGHVERIVGIRKAESVRDVDLSLAAKGRGQAGIEVSTSKSHRYRIEVHPHSVDLTVAADAPSD